ncbi:MAG TPA: hypothetical protein VJQ25_04385 [Nitrospira sp.]|nr:hypothetical protein [Nitrospira sp.]
MRVLIDKKKPALVHAKVINFTVDDPVTFERIYHVEMTREEVTDAVAYLREHNGNAPSTVHALIDAMEVSLTMRVRPERAS